MIRAHRIGLVTVLCACTSSVVIGQQPFDLDPAFRAEFNDWYVSSILPQPDGKVIISGQFTFPGGEPLEFTGIGRLNADGSWDPSFEHSQLGRGKMVAWNDRFYIASTQSVRRVFLDGTNDDGYHLGTVQIPYFLSLQGGDYHVYPDGRVLMSGAHQVNYPDSNWVGIYNLIWFTNEGYLDTTRAPGMGDGVIYRFKELPDGKFICTGPMSVYDGQPTSFIFRVNADGSFDPSFSTGTNWGQAACYLPLPDGRCYVGGLFRREDGPDTLQAVRLMPDGSLDPTFNNYLRFEQQVLTTPWGDFGTVESIQYLDPGRLLVTGAFREVDGQPRLSICVIDTTGAVVDGYFIGEGCGTYTYQGFTDASIVGLQFVGDTSCYIWGSYHGYDDGTTNDPLQRFVTRLYGPDLGMGVAQRPQEPTASLDIAPNPASEQISISFGSISGEEAALIAVKDVLGKEVKTMRVSGSKGQVIWDCRRAPAGTYTISLFAASGAQLAVERAIIRP